jgi:hypothetical protein
VPRHQDWVRVPALPLGSRPVSFESFPLRVAKGLAYDRHVWTREPFEVFNCKTGVSL